MMFNKYNLSLPCKKTYGIERLGDLPRVRVRGFGLPFWGLGHRFKATVGDPMEEQKLKRRVRP